MSELLLVIDTSTRAGSIALSRGEQLLAESAWQGPGTHSDWLLGHLEGLLHEAGIEPVELNGIGVVVGPGSFTGLRVGVATAKGLAVAAGCPLVGLSSLALLACSAPFARFPVCSLLDARKNEVYAGLYRTEHGLPEAQVPDRVLPPEDLLRSLEGEILFAGEGASVYRSLIVRVLGSRAHFLSWAQHMPRAAFGAPLVLQALRQGEAVPPELLRLHYVRPSEAEIAWSRRAAEGVIDG